MTQDSKIALYTGLTVIGIRPSWRLPARHIGMMLGEAVNKMRDTTGGRVRR